MTDWISVKDRLPSGMSGNVLAFRPSAPQEARVVSLWFDPVHNGWSGKYKVTHWQPLPRQPED